MWQLAWVISILAATHLGYRFRELEVLISSIRESVKAKIDKPKPEAKIESSIIDPDDILAVAQFEERQRLKRLNPEVRDDL